MISGAHELHPTQHRSRRRTMSLLFRRMTTSYPPVGDATMRPTAGESV
jgi:hypothetical protein